MASTVFTDKVTMVPAAWANDVNTLVYQVFKGAATAIDARTALGLGSLALQNMGSIVIQGGTMDGVTVGGSNPQAGTFTTASVTSLTPTLPQHLVSKQYFDNQMQNIVQTLLVIGGGSALIGSKVNRSGDTMTGPLIMAEDPQLALEAATKQYVDAVQTNLTGFETSLAGSNGATLVGYGSTTVKATLDTIATAVAANVVFAGPASGASAVPAFRALALADLSFAGQANGVATLDGTGKVPLAQLPAATLNGMKYQGLWNASTNSPTLASGVGLNGYLYVVSVAGTTTLDGISNWNVGDWAIFDGTAWTRAPFPSVVYTVAGRSGNVVLTYADIGGLANVAHTGSFADLTNVPVANTTQLGLVKVGSGLTIDGSGVLSANAAVTSVGLTAPSIFSVTNSPITSSGNLAFDFLTQPVNTVLAGPASGASAAQPTFRSLVAADLPIATTTANGGVKVPASGGIAVTIDGSLNINTGPGLAVASNALTIANGAGLTFAGSNLTLAPATTTTIGGIIVGSGLAITSGGVLSVTGGGGGSGSVTSVGLQMPPDFTVTNSPITSSGTLQAAWNSQNANVVLAGPTSGVAAAPSFRPLVVGDLPPTTSSATFLAGPAVGGGAVSYRTITGADLPIAGTTTLGAIKVPVASSLSVDGTGNLSFISNANMLHNSSGGSGALGWGIPGSFSTLNVYGPLFINNTGLSSVSAGLISPSAPAVASTTYTLSGDIYNQSTAGTIQLAIIAYDSGGTMIGSGAFASSSNAPTGGWSRISVTGTTPANTAYLAADVFLSNVTAASGNVAFRRLKLELGSVPTAYSTEGDTLAATSTMTGLVKGGGTVSVAADGTMNIAPGGTTAQWVLGNGTVSNTLAGSATIQGQLTLSLGSGGNGLSINSTGTQAIQQFTSSGGSALWYIDGSGNMLLSKSNGSFANTGTMLQIAPNGNTIFNGTSCTFGSAATSNVGIELGSVTTVISTTLDFHSSGNNIDYDSRIIATGGTTSVGQGQLQFIAAGVTVNAPTTVLSGGGSSTDFKLTNTSNSTNKTIRVNSANTNLEFVNSAYTTVISTLTDAGVWSAADFTATSDARAKTDIRPLMKARELMRLIEGKSFTMKASGKKSIGFIAQDFQKHEYLKDLVHVGDNGMLSLSYGPVSALLVEAFKEQDQEIQALKAHLGM